MLRIFILLLIIANATFIGEAQEPIVLYPSGTHPDLFERFGYEIETKDDMLAVSANVRDTSSLFQPAVFIFRKDGTEWVEESIVMDSSDNQSAVFGWEMTIAGDYIYIGDAGSEANGVNEGTVYIYKNESGSWIFKSHLYFSNVTFDPACAAGIAAYDDYLFIGCTRDTVASTNAGSAFIFRREGDAWIEQAKLIPSDSEYTSGFGRYLYLHQNYAFIGATGAENSEGDRTGAIYVFELVGEEWIETDRLIAADIVHNDGFIVPMSYDSDTLIIGAVKAAGINSFYKGAAYIYERQGNNWEETDKIVPEDDLDKDLALTGWAIDGNYMALANANNIDNAFVHLFQKNGGVWEEVLTITKEMGDNYDRFGDEIAIADKQLIVGAWGHRYMGIDSIKSGAVYIYDLDILLDSNEPPISTQPLQIRPNPAGAIIDVSLELENPVRIERLDIYNFNGQLVRSIAGDGLARRTHQWSVDTGGFPAGLYVLKGVGEEGIFTGRLLKVGAD